MARECRDLRAKLGGQGHGFHGIGVQFDVVRGVSPGGHGRESSRTDVQIHVVRGVSPGGHGHESSRTGVPIRVVRHASDGGHGNESTWSGVRIHVVKGASPGAHDPESSLIRVWIQLVSCADPTTRGMAHQVNNRPVCAGSLTKATSTLGASGRAGVGDPRRRMAHVVASSVPIAWIHARYRPERGTHGATWVSPSRHKCGAPRSRSGHWHARHSSARPPNHP